MLELKKDESGKVLPVRSLRVQKVCSPDDLVHFFKYGFSPKEKKFKMICLLQLGTESRLHESCAVQLEDFEQGSNFRKLRMLIQKKAKCIHGKIKGHNVIVEKILPESIACFIRNWIEENYDWIISTNGHYIFPSSKMQPKSSYTPPSVVMRWFCKKRQQLASLFPERSYGVVIGQKTYNKCFLKEYKLTTDKLYLWSSHIFKRFAGTYAYLFTKDAVFCQHLLEHEDLKTTSRHYIDGVGVASQYKKELVKNKMYDKNFFDSISNASDEVMAVWDFKEKPLTN